MLEIKTIETAVYEKMDDGVHVKQVGMITAEDAFKQLNAHLEKVGLMPDEYFISFYKAASETVLPDFTSAVCHTDWGDSEGIYINISLKYYDEENQPKFFDLATGKSLGSGGDDFLRMSRIAAECSMMLNGRGKIVKVSENTYDNIQLTQEEKGLIAKALDKTGDMVADHEGYSSGEKYWDLAKKFVSSIVPHKEKAEPEAQLRALMQKAFDMLPKHINKAKITPFMFYDLVRTRADQNKHPFRDLYCLINRLMYPIHNEDKYVKLFNDVQSQYKPSLSSQIQSAESKSINVSEDLKTPNKDKAPLR